MNLGEGDSESSAPHGLALRALREDSQIDMIAYALIPHGPDMVPYLHGATLAVGAVFTTGVDAWIALSGR